MAEGMEQAPRVPGYDVLGVLGQGASATVWRARRHGDGLDVALKVLRPAGGDVSAGLREAGLLAGVRHRHVVRLHDVLPLPDPQTGRPAAVALAMQLAGGGSLAQVLARRRILSAGELVTALQPVASALADLHGRGVVHGDLSTGNVLFLSDGMPLLSDLGAARITGVPAGDPEGTGARSGLVAPEVLEGFPPTQESDVYQLGAIAWLCLAGEPPGLAWLRGSLEELAPGLPAGLAGLVTRCLTPEPGDRPDAEEVALALLATTTPEPVEVAPDADPGHGLTERLRRQAQEDLGPLAEEQRESRGRVIRGWGSRGGARPGIHRPEHVRGLGGASAVSGRVRLAVTMVALLTAGVVALTVWPAALGGVPGIARDGTTSGEDQAPATAPGVMEHPARSEPEPEPKPASEAASTSAARSLAVVGTLQALVEGRAEAWSSGDPSVLRRFLAPGSPALDAETASLARAGEQALRYPDVAFRVEEARVVEETGERLTVDALVARDPLRGVGAEGEVLVEEPASTERVRFVLTRSETDEAWRLWSWAPG